MTPMRPAKPALSALRQAALWAAAACALGAVFVAYLDPQLAFSLATRAWACF